jgi:hypothetical protein
MQPEYVYFQAIADLLSEEKEAGSSWFWPEWQMLFRALLIAKISADPQANALLLWFFYNSSFLLAEL